MSSSPSSTSRSRRNFTVCTGDTDRGGRLVAAHRLGLRGDEEVEVAADRLGERSHPGHAGWRRSP